MMGPSRRIGILVHDKFKQNLIWSGLAEGEQPPVTNHERIMSSVVNGQEKWTSAEAEPKAREFITKYNIEMLFLEANLGHAGDGHLNFSNSFFREFPDVQFTLVTSTEFKNFTSLNSKLDSLVDMPNVAIDLMGFDLSRDRVRFAFEKMNIKSIEQSLPEINTNPVVDPLSGTGNTGELHTSPNDPAHNVPAEGEGEPGPEPKIDIVR